MNLGRKREKQSKGGLAIAKGRFVLSVTIPLLLYESLGIFVLSWAFVLMFFNYSSGRLGGPILGLGGTNPFVGLGNFIEMFNGTSVQANLFRTSLKNTLIFAFAILPLNLAITLPLAYLLDSIRRTFQGFLPDHIFPARPDLFVGVALIWMSMYDPQAGPDQRHHPHVWWSARLLAFNPRAGLAGVSVAMWAVILAYLLAGLRL